MNTLLRKETIAIQGSLAMFCRNGEEVHIPGVVQERLPHYRRLVYNIVDGTLSNAFPILKSYISDDLWDEMVNHFFGHHKSSTPLLWKLPYEFLEYANQNGFSKKYNLPYLSDLLLFEWLEVELFMMENLPIPTFKEDGDLLKDIIVLNPEHRLVHLSYPVHKKWQKDQWPERGNFYLLIYRDLKSGSVQFIEISVLHVLIIEGLKRAEPLSLILENAKMLLNVNDGQNLKNAALAFKEDLKIRGFILGFNQ